MWEHASTAADAAGAAARQAAEEDRKLLRNFTQFCFHICFLYFVCIYDAFMKKILKFALLVLGFRYVLKLMDENVDIKIQIKKLRNELANLETEDLENKLKDFFKKYDPKFKDQEENQEDF